VDLLIDQIEFCDVLILNKCDRVEQDELQALESVLRSLQPRARIVRTAYGRVDPTLIMNTGLFDFEEASRSAGWIQELEKAHHVPETEEYGISSFVYERARPFHPERLMAWMSEWPSEVVRAKGIVWLATRSDMAQNFSQAGPSIQFGPAGRWIATLPEAEQAVYKQAEPKIAAAWHPVHGDRVNQIVFIGLSMNRRELCDQLDQCLLTEAEMTADLREFADRFPNATDIQLEEQFG